MPVDDHKLRIDANRAVRAKQLLENELFNEAFDALEKAYLAGWRQSDPRDSEGREKLFAAVHIAAKVKQHFVNVISNGSVAQKELERMAEDIKRANERKRRFGVV